MPVQHQRRASMPAAELEAAARFRTELRRFHRATEAVTSSEGLTPERYDLLLMIAAAQRNGRNVTVSSLREALQLPQQGVTETVKRAVKAGLVTREPSPDDGRVKYLRLTPEGERRLKQAFRALRHDRAAFAKAFDRLTLSFRATAPPARPRRRSATG